MIRLKDTQSSAPPGLQQLLRRAKPTRGMTEVEKIRSTARITQLVAAPAAPAPLLALPKIAGTVIGIGGGVALLANLGTPPLKREDCIPTPMASQSEAPTRHLDTDESDKKQLRDKPVQEDIENASAPSPPIPKAPRLKSIPPPKRNRVPTAATNAVTQMAPPNIDVVPSPTPSALSMPNDESHYIDEATIALSTSPSDALLHIEEHEKRFPNGMLAEEREFLAIRALVKLGRTSDAQKRAKQALRQQRSSSYKTKIQDLLTTIPNNKSE